MRSSEDITAELEKLQRDEDAIRDAKRELHVELRAALIAERRAIPTLDLTTPEGREALRAELAALDKAEG